MCALKTEYCVEIRVPKTNGKHKFGSGYTLGPNWVLTAHHVLFGKEVDDARPLKITWRDAWGNKTGDGKEGGQSLFLVSRDNIAWYNEKHDIALICFEPPYKNVPGAWEELAREELTQKALEWQVFKSAGFLSNLHDEEKEQRRVTPQGSLGGCSEGNKTIALDGSSVKLDDNEDWAGFSGSPVFVNDKLVAVVQTLRTGESSLNASLISEALYTEDEGDGQPALRNIRGFLIAPGRQKCWELLQKKLVEILKDTPDVFTALKEDYLNKINADADIKNATVLTDLLYTTTNLEVIQCFNSVATTMRKRQQVQEVHIMRDLASAWLLLMAADQGNICDIEAFKKNTSAHSLDIRAAEPVLLDVEGQAANAEDRSPHLRLVGKILRSPFDLTPDQAVGFDEDGRQTAKDVREKHKCKTKPGFEVFSLEEAKSELEKFATRPETGLSSPLSPDDDVQRGIEIGDQLDWACEELEEEMEEKISYYIRLPEPISQDSYLNDLHKWCPQLLIFTVSGIDNRDRKRCLSGLHRIIHRAETFLNEQSEEL